MSTPSEQGGTPMTWWHDSEENVIPELFEKAIAAFVSKNHGEFFQFRTAIKPIHVINAFGRHIATRFSRYPDLPPIEHVWQRVLDVCDYTPSQVRDMSPQDLIQAIPEEWDEFLETLPEQVQVLTINIITPAKP